MSENDVRFLLDVVIFLVVHVQRVPSESRGTNAKATEKLKMTHRSVNHAFIAESHQEGRKNENATSKHESCGDSRVSNSPRKP